LPAASGSNSGGGISNRQLHASSASKVHRLLVQSVQKVFEIHTILDLLRLTVATFQSLFL
jgi:hypothetical protein